MSFVLEGKKCFFFVEKFLKRYVSIKKCSEGAEFWTTFEIFGGDLVEGWGGGFSGLTRAGAHV